MDIKNLVTENDTEALDAKIESFKQDIVQQHHLDIEGEEFLEYLVAKSMKLGELYERKRWQEAQAQAPEANALLSATLDAVQKLGSGDFVLVPVIDIELAIEALEEAGEGESKYYAGCADGLRKALESLEKNNGN